MCLTGVVTNMFFSLYRGFLFDVGLPLFKEKSIGTASDITFAKYRLAMSAAGNLLHSINH